MSLDEFEAYQLDPEIQAVVVGLDTEFTYSKLCIASLYIHTGKAKFIATNDDPYDMVNGRKMPAAGAMVQSIKYTLGQLESHQTTKLDGATFIKPHHEPEVIGKPNPYVIDLIKRERGIIDTSRYVIMFKF